MKSLPLSKVYELIEPGPVVLNKFNLFILEVQRAWVDPKQKNLKMIHHQGMVFLLSTAIKLKCDRRKNSATTFAYFQPLTRSNETTTDFEAGV